MLCAESVFIRTFGQQGRTVIFHANQAESVFLYFSEIEGLRVVDRDNNPVGILFDILIEPMGKYARAKTLVVAGGGTPRSRAFLEWEKVAEIVPQHLRLNVGAAEVSFVKDTNHKSDLSLRQDILDQQVVDTNNQNVIRVNDIHLLQAEQNLVVAHVDIGLRGIVRRLGFEKCVDGLVGLFRKNSSYLAKPRLIAWKHIQPLSINPVSMTIKVDVSQKHLTEIPAADLSEIMLELAPPYRTALFKTLDTAVKSRLFVVLDFKDQESLLEDLGEKEGVELLSHLPPDEAADFLGELPKATSRKMLGLMETKSAKMLSVLLGYSGESAGGIMTTQYIAVPEEGTVADALKVIREKTAQPEAVSNVFIVDSENHLKGATSLLRLIAADPALGVVKAAFKRTVNIHVDDDVKKIALLMDKYKIHVLPVVDANNVLAGIITIDDILSRLVAIAWRRSRRRKQLL